MIFLEEDNQQISSIVTEGEELLYTYKNYIYREKIWKYLIYNTDNDHCEHYHYTLYKGFYLKDCAYKIKLSQ